MLCYRMHTKLYMPASLECWITRLAGDDDCCSRKRLLRQARRPHQERIDGPRAEAAFADRPDDERLSAAHVAGGEHFSQRGLVVGGVGAHIAARVEFDAESL